MRLYLAVLLLVGSALVTGPATADVSVNVIVGPPPPPIVLAVPPPLVVVPGVPVVSYAPSLQVDLFFHENLWYYSHGGYWYVSPTHRGPWTHVVVAKLPRPIFAVPVRYYKVPPGHLKRLRDGPPGHAKGRGKGRD